MDYDHSYLTNELKSFEGVFSIGKSVEGRDIYVIPVGRGANTAVFAAAFHALEYLTAAALLEFAKQYRSMRGYLDDIRVFFIPMINPDGVEIATHGLDPKNELHRELIRCCGIIDYRGTWQANARGVDINHNFDADWQPIYDKPAPSRWGGRYPGSEPETQALIQFLDGLKPQLFIAFHSQGKEIYYDFNGMESKRSKAIAEKMGAKTGYRVCRPTGSAAFGGAKDMFIKRYHREAFTIELGKGKNPLPHSALPEMISDTAVICKTALNEVFPRRRSI